MASISKTTMNNHQPTYSSDPTAPNTTFVQADPSTFRTIVQKLTGAPEDSSSSQKLHLTPKKPTFKLHERRQSAKKLEINLHNINNKDNNPAADPFSFVRSPRGFLVSPVSHFDFWARVSPRSPQEDGYARESPHEKEEERVIAEKGFYLHPSPLSTPRGGGAEPELLPLFPLYSPRDTDD